MAKMEGKLKLECDQFVKNQIKSDSSVTKLISIEAWGLEFGAQKSSKKSGMVSWVCSPSTKEVEKWGGGVTGTHWPVGLAECGVTKQGGWHLTVLTVTSGVHMYMYHARCSPAHTYEHSHTHVDTQTAEQQSRFLNGKQQKQS